MDHTTLRNPIRTRMTVALLSIGMCAVPGATGVHAQAVPSGDWRADVASFANRIVTAGLAPGLGVAITQGDRVAYAAGFGSADMESGRPVEVSTPFYIASSTKSLTALAAVLRASRGALDLHAPISRYLPTLRLRPPLSADSITVEDLLTLTHGIDDGGPVVTRTAYTGDFTPELLLQLLGQYPPSRSGRDFVYGNLGYNILGMVLETNAGAGWKEVVNQEVMRPVGMSGTTAYVSRVAPQQMAQPHAGTPEGFRRIVLGKADANMHAAGGHFATPRDLARYVAAQQSGGMLDGQRIFPREAVLGTQRLHATQGRTFGPFHRFGWGYGWDLGTYEADTLIHRFGSFAGYRSHMSFMPRRRLGVVVLTNGDGSASPVADLLATYIYDRMLGKPNVTATYETRLAELRARSREQGQRQAVQLATRRERQRPLPHPIRMYEGTYSNATLGEMVWTVRGDVLEVRMGVAAGRAEVLDASANKLRIEIAGGGEVVEFQFAADGGAATLLRYDGQSFVRREGARPR